MSWRTRVGNRDKAEPYFIAAHQAAGDAVLQISVKDGPDLVIGSHGANWLVEVKSEIANERKDGYTRTSKGKLKPGQEAFAKAWKGGKVLAAYLPLESLKAVGHTPTAIRAALWEAGLHWMLEEYAGPEPTKAQWRKCREKKCAHRLLSSYTPPRGPGVAAAKTAAETFAPPPNARDRAFYGGMASRAKALKTLQCERPGCGHSWESHRTAEEPMWCTHCTCSDYIGMGPASLRSAK